ncbi:MAG: CoA transferase [Saprospiraceae bacterium]|nr:CoA transferase [Saprospiraceae bacterium]
MSQFDDLLKNLKVLELATALAGPLTGTFLKELGADVLKIEPPHGDVSRYWKNSFEPVGSQSIYYQVVNGDKKTMTLDLRNSTARKQLSQLIQESDIVITNFHHQQAEKFGMTFEKLSAIKSDIILGNITGYGPKSGKAAFDMMIQADSGLISMTGSKGGMPTKVPIAIADILASHQLRSGTLCALLKKGQTGKGSEIQVSLIDSMISALTNQAGNYLMGKQIPVRMGTLHPSIAPYGEVFETADAKSLLIAVGSEGQFQALCYALNKEEWQEHPKYRDNQNRLINRIDLEREIYPVIKSHPAKFWLAKFEKYNIPAALIRNLQEVLDDPEAAHMLVNELKDQIQIRRLKTFVF